ncbi:MAG: hypothetical protein IJ270_07680 [Paludibacteraceae bacterium]|nr:hypothetical protein [Paludibacteraceae bacterium]
MGQFIPKLNNEPIEVSSIGSFGQRITNKGNIQDVIRTELIKMFDSGCSLVDILMKLNPKGDWKDTWKITLSIPNSSVQIMFNRQELFDYGQKFNSIEELPLYEIHNHSISKIDKIELRNNTNGFENIDWDKISVEELQSELNRVFKEKNYYYTKEEAIQSLPNELIIRTSGHYPYSIRPYDEYGYEIVNISAAGSERWVYVFVHIKKKG